MAHLKLAKNRHNKPRGQTDEATTTEKKERPVPQAEKAGAQTLTDFAAAHGIDLAARPFMQWPPELQRQYLDAQA